LTPDNASLNTGANVALSRLLTDYPQYGTFRVQEYDGKTSYDALFVRLEKRFTKGLSFLATYTYSKALEWSSQLNPWEPLEERISWADRPHRFIVATVAELPFGKGRKFGNEGPSLMDAVLGGWTFSANYNFQSGEPLTFSSNVYWDSACGDPKDVLKTSFGAVDGKKQGIDIPAWDTSCFYSDQATGRTFTYKSSEIAVTGNNIRTFPTRLPNMRGQPQHSLDVGLAKNFKLGGRANLQLRADVINALNYTLFREVRYRTTPTSSDFGFNYDPGASTVRMRPRDIQLGARLTF
jgi:hypothetical protein